MYLENAYTYGLAVPFIVLETCDLIGFTVAEVSKTVADVVMISGLTMTVAFADLKELEKL